MFLVLSRKKVVKSSSLGNSSGVSRSCLSFSKYFIGFSVSIRFTVFGFLPNTRSNGLLPLAVAAVLRPNKRCERPVVPLFKIIVLSALSRLFSLLMRRFILPFPRWSRIGHSICCM